MLLHRFYYFPLSLHLYPQEEVGDLQYLSQHI